MKASESALVVKLFHNQNSETLLVYVVNLLYISICITITIIDKILLYKFVIAKVSYKSLLKYLFDCITPRFVFYQNP